MDTRRGRQKEATEDFLGLATIVSLAANIGQFFSRKTLENNCEVLKNNYGLLKGYVAKLEHSCKEAVNRNQQLSNAYMSLKKINEGFAQQVRTLEGMVAKANEENLRLEKELNALKMHGTAETKRMFRRKRRVLRKEGTNV